MREAVLLAYTQEEEVDTLSNGGAIIASSINFEELTSSGWAYQFDVSELEEEFTQEGVKENLFEIINKAALVLGKSKYKDIQKGPFYFWFTQKDNVFGASGENGSAQILFITPFYNDRATRVRSTIDPLYDYIKTTVGFIRVESGNPIYENSLPLFMYSNGELTRIQVDEYFLEDAATFQKNIMRNMGLMSDDYFSIYKMFLNS